jgi:hypothetical protein
VLCCIYLISHGPGSVYHVILYAITKLSPVLVYPVVLPQYQQPCEYPALYCYTDSTNIGTVSRASPSLEMMISPYLAQLERE